MFPAALITVRLLLRPIAMDDGPAIFDGYARDPEVSCHLLWRPLARLENTQAYLSACLAATDVRTYAIINRTRGTPIGTFDLRKQAPWRMGFGCVLARSAWGRGLMTEALIEVVGWALAQPGIWRIGDLVDTENIASARVMEKAGLQREGLLRRFGVHPNVSDEPRDCYIHGKVRSAA
jgi:[ribosomal protein S5]-alanine N-acetyltransferase